MMIKQPSLSPETQKYIRQKLYECEKMNNIKILLAIESGSRAWGFPSVDSDYDVRFIYSRSLKDYLSLCEYNDHVEIPIMFDQSLGVPFDLNGWDIRKALKLAIKSNPVLVEWLVSPVVYIKKEMSEQLLNFAIEMANSQIFLYHYYRLASNAWQKIQEDPSQVKTKLYCYALRPVISMQWILSRSDLPPMDMPALCKGIITSDTLYNEICLLIERKAKVKETDLMPRSIILDGFIESTLENKVVRLNIQDEMCGAIEKANKLFYGFVGMREGC